MKRDFDKGRGRQVVLKMLKICRFSHKTKRKFLHTSQPGLGKGSKKAKILSTWLKNDPKKKMKRDFDKVCFGLKLLFGLKSYSPTKKVLVPT